MATGLELVHVRKGRGRIHLTPARTAEGIVHTLCGKELDGAAITEDEPDCQACLRREGNPASLSSAFFNQEEGSRLLELSLAAAQRRREGRPDLRVVPPPRPLAKRSPAPEPPPPDRRGELHLAGLRQFSDGVYVSPGGVVVRLDGERIAEVTSEARAHLARSRDGLKLRLGDMLFEERGGVLDARVEHPRAR